MAETQPKIITERTLDNRSIRVAESGGEIEVKVAENGGLKITDNGLSIEEKPSIKLVSLGGTELGKIQLD